TPVVPVQAGLGDQHANLLVGHGGSLAPFRCPLPMEWVGWRPAHCVVIIPEMGAGAQVRGS
ncbi:MAG: hypothetical protein AB1716_23810, partial [Planctomycetota bacterium]